ncbi:hypothetical protein HYW42_01640 [Candidatus Daviesbacteria bacterium]|nr:hypothetical protein [Candidatus Daviesbacteria bacterium]
MKPLLLHGSAINTSRKKLSEIRQKFEDITTFGKNTSFQELVGSLMTVPLLSEQRLIILENPPEDFEFGDIGTQTFLAIWFDHEVSEKKKIIIWAKQNAHVFYFPPEKEITIFPFLDLLANKDKKAFVQIEKLKESKDFDSFYFLTMSFYLLRNLTTDSKAMPVFVKQKLEKQRKNFSKKEIKKIYKQILEIEYKLKNGLMEQDQAEFLLIYSFVN